MLNQEASPDPSPEIPEISEGKVGKPRWPAIVAFLVIGLFYGILSDNLTILPGWTLLPVLVIIVSILIATRLRGLHDLNRFVALGVTAMLTITTVGSVILLISELPKHNIPAAILLRDAVLIWSINVIVFALWYWQVDGGGPARRRRHQHETSDFLFPQFSSGGPGGSNWSPEFIDYLFLAFNTSTAFSPTDTSVLSRRAKVLMMLQASISLVVLAVLAARAINIL